MHGIRSVSVKWQVRASCEYIPAKDYRDTPAVAALKIEPSIFLSLFLVRHMCNVRKSSNLHLVQTITGNITSIKRGLNI